MIKNNHIIKKLIYNSLNLEPINNLPTPISYYLQFECYVNNS